MKYLLSFVFAFLVVTHNVLAGNLCEGSCELIIDFPDGGSIDAVAALTITFGDGGFINDGAVTTGYAIGETEILLAGNTISFNSDGMLNLGVGGNIEYTDMIFNSTGGASLIAIGGNKEIIIENLTLSGGLNITFNASLLSVLGTLSINSDSVLNLIADTNAVTSSVCSVQDTSATLTISTGTVDTSDTCGSISINTGLTANQLTVGIIDPNVTLSSVGTIPTVDVGELTLTPEESKSSGNSNGGMGRWFLCLIVLCLACCRKFITVDRGNACLVSAV